MIWYDAQNTAPQPWEIVIFYVRYPDTEGAACGYTQDGNVWTQLTAWGLKAHDRRYVWKWANMPKPTESD